MQPDLDMLVSYQYDATDRLVASTASGQADTQRFYRKDRLTSEVQGVEHRSLIQHADQPLAQQQLQGCTVETRLLATDQQRSVLNVISVTHRNSHSYTPYGHHPPGKGLPACSVSMANGRNR